MKRQCIEIKIVTLLVAAFALALLTQLAVLKIFIEPTYQQREDKETEETAIALSGLSSLSKTS